jgi:hypothetical protein
MWRFEVKRLIAVDLIEVVRRWNFPGILTRTLKDPGKFPGRPWSWLDDLEVKMNP